MERIDLQGLSRDELIAHAERLGVPRPRVLTQPELIDEIISRTSRSERERAKSRGWLGRARDLLARVVEKGLHLPEAAKVLRATPTSRAWPTPPPPLATVTLAEIYAAQGHLDKAIGVLNEVLSREPEHQEARVLRDRFVEQADKSRGRAATGRSEEMGTDAEGAAGTQVAGEAPAIAAEAAPTATDASAVAAATTFTAPEETVAAAEATPTASEETATAAATAFTAPEEPEAAAEATPTASEETATAAEATPTAPEETEAAAEATPTASEETATAAEATPTASEETVTAAEATPTASEETVTAAATAPIAVEATLPAAEDHEPPLPERYDVDEAVAIAVDPKTLYVYWEVRPQTFARAAAKKPAGHLSIRVVAITPSWDGPLTKTWDLPVDALYGDRFIRDIPPGANVRVSVGWLEATTFDPFAVGLEVASPRAIASEHGAEEVGTWAADAGYHGHSPAALRAAGAAHLSAHAGGGALYNRASSENNRMTWRRGGLEPRAFGGGGGAGAASPGGEHREGAVGGAAPWMSPETKRAVGGDARSWMAPEAQRAASPSFGRGGASELRGGASDLSRAGS